LNFSFGQITPAARPDYSACSGCSLCLLVCPVWRKTRDLSLTPHGRAKALQHGASVEDIAASINSCTLCGACEPACPENITLVDMIANLRRWLPRSAAVQGLETRMEVAAARPIVTRYASRRVWLPGAALRRHPEALARTGALLRSGGTFVMGDDDGSDIALALETGAVVPAQHLERFLGALRRLQTVVVADGLLLHHLRRWLPRKAIVSLGAALSRVTAVRRGLRATDLYVIEPRAYHADHARLVRHYDRLRIETGCAMNLDLQRIAIPATARNLRQRLGLEPSDDAGQTRWLLHRRKIQRIVVESVEDAAAFAQVGDRPVVHVADLADDGKMIAGFES
jgi:ferredoxin